MSPLFDELGHELMATPKCVQFSSRLGEKSARSLLVFLMLRLSAEGQPFVYFHPPVASKRHLLSQVGLGFGVHTVGRGAVCAGRIAAHASSSSFSAVPLASAE